MAHDRRRALVTLGMLAALFLGLQPAGHAVAAWYAPRLELVVPGGATGLQWRSLRDQRPAPEVVFLGDSRARTDVDAHAVSRALGRPVGTLGPNGSDMATELLLVDRVLALPKPPAAVAIGVTQFQFNSGYRRDFTPDYWQLDDPLDPGYARDVVRVDPQRARFIAGTLLPLYADLPVLARAADCEVQALRGSTRCRIAGRYATDQAFLRDFQDSFLRRYAYSSAREENLREAIARCHRAGVRVVLVTYPERTDGLMPDGYLAFLDRMSAIAAQTGVLRVDLHAWRPSSPALWDDPIHLRPEGAAELAPVLAAALT